MRLLRSVEHVGVFFSQFLQVTFQSIDDVLVFANLVIQQADFSLYRVDQHFLLMNAMVERT